MATVTQGYTWTSGETVTPAKLNSAAAPTVVVANDEITTAKILDANVTNAKLASGIDASKITTGTLPIARIADDAITNDKLSLSANAGEIKKALNADNDPPIYACRAWVQFDGTTVNGSNECTIQGSGNVSSVVRTSTGNYTINFATAMPDANYAVSTTAPNSNGRFASITSQSAGSCVVNFAAQTGSNANISLFSVAVFR